MFSMCSLFRLRLDRICVLVLLWCYWFIFLFLFGVSGVGCWCRWVSRLLVLCGVDSIIIMLWLVVVMVCRVLVEVMLKLL